MHQKLWDVIQVFIFHLHFISLRISIFGFSTTYVNTPVNQFKAYINESLIKRDVVMTAANYDTIWNIFLNIWFVGFFLGIWLSPILNDRYGRKVGFLTGNSVAFLASILQCVAIYWFVPELLIVARFMTSVCMAVTYQSCILYIQECSPTHLRGFMTFLSEVSFSTMTLFGSILGTQGVLGNHLFWLVFFVVPFCFIFLVGLIFLPETPKFLLIVKRDNDAAIKSVRFYHGPCVDAKSVLESIQMEEEEGEEQTISTSQALKDLFREPYLRKALMISVSALQNTVALWALLLSSTYFLENANMEPKIAQWSSNSMNFAYVLGAISGTNIIERWGRRPLLLSFTFANNVALLAFVLFTALQPLIDWLKYGCLAALIVYGYTYGCGVGPISWFISSELVPQKYRSITQSAAYAINTVMVVISSFTVLPLYSALGSYAFLLLYSIPSTFSLIFLFRALPETKGREVYDIVKQLRGK
ncbi:unnamed protein product [Caenorhabditis auriculariae]|uniref:Major facilitator superfamily (MFS) profile domain-containing protein n=1 Tax=Caenorhabditis auriculariae TaxID=2777116 RepID=A0A8S1HQY0_9PELO|nr:unnamed protein product [Caenorhabditis auriculariae]